MDSSFTKEDENKDIVEINSPEKDIVRILKRYCKDVVEVNSHEMINFRFGPDGRDVSLSPRQKMTEKGETIQDKVFK